jgi:hypothetical protein
METELDKTATFFRFEDLRIYLKALDYIDWVYKKVNKFPETGSISLASNFTIRHKPLLCILQKAQRVTKLNLFIILKWLKVQFVNVSCIAQWHTNKDFSLIPILTNRGTN